MIDSGRISVRNRDSIDTREESSEEEVLPVKGGYKNVPDIQVLIDYWTNEVQQESFRQSESNFDVSPYNRVNDSEVSTTSLVQRLNSEDDPGY
jgi:hypothetical protein